MVTRKSLTVLIPVFLALSGMLPATLVCADRDVAPPWLADHYWSLEYSAEYGNYCWIGDSPLDATERIDQLRRMLTSRSMQRYDVLAAKLHFLPAQKASIRLAVRGEVARITALATKLEAYCNSSQPSLEVMQQCIDQLEEKSLALPFGKDSIATKVARRILSDSKFEQLQTQADSWARIDPRLAKECHW